MEFRHLRYFLALAEELHYGRAAQRLSITQPPLSLNIQQLESSVGARLFDRDSKGVRLTAAGRAFRESAITLLANADEARALARDVEAGALGRLRVGFVGSMLFRGLPQWLERHRAQQPRVDVSLRELNSQEQVDALLHDQLDVGFIHTQRVPEGIQALFVHAEPFLCCVHHEHPLRALKKVPLARLRDQPFVLFSRLASPDYFRRIIEMCAAQGFNPRVTYEVRHWLSVVSLVAQGMGVSVVPASLKKSGITGAAFRPLLDSSEVSEVYCVWNTSSEDPARDRFLEVMQRTGAAARAQRVTSLRRP